MKCDEDEDEEWSQEFIEFMEKRECWLKKTIPPDDVYEFLNQMLLGWQITLEFIDEHHDIKKICAQSKKMHIWISNFLNINYAMSEDKNVTITTVQRRYD